MKEWAEEFYNSQAWRDTREAYLINVDYECERCSTEEVPVLAVIVHHQKYLTQENINDPRITLAWSNLEALCQDCHNKEHIRKKRRLRYGFDADGNMIPPGPEGPRGG